MITNKTIAIYTAYAHKLPIARRELLERLMNNNNTLIVLGLEDQCVGDQAFVPMGIKYSQIPLSRHGLSIRNEIKGIKVISDVLKDNNVQAMLTYGIRLVLSANNAAKKRHIKPVNVINGAGTLFADQSVKGKILKYMIYPILRNSFKKSGRIIFQNKDDLDEFCNLGLTDAHMCELTHGSGVNLEAFPMSSLPEQDVFGIDRRLSEDKGIWELINAYKKLKEKKQNVKLRIAGCIDGLSETEFKKEIQNCGIEYLGEIGDIKGFLNGCRYFVYPSFYREGVPRSILEALASGRPIITTNMPGCRDTVIDGCNGYIVNPRDINGLYEAMYKICMNKQEIQDMSKMSRKIAEDKFDVNKNNEIVVEALEKTMK